MKALLVAVAVVIVSALAPLGRAETFASECAPAGSVTPSRLAIGAQDCIRMQSTAMGGTTAFSYFIPPACAQARCPVLFVLHGSGGSYQTALGAKGASPPGTWVRALTAGPSVDPASVTDPWNYGDPATWVPRPPVDVILIAPHGRTVPGGYGPSAGLDTGWTDWNPKYAAGGAYPRYATPAPRTGTFLISELVPFVSRHFRAGMGRASRAIVGSSHGGLGAFNNGLSHPDLWSSIGALSAGPIPIPTFDPLEIASPMGIAPPVDAPYVSPPGPTAVAAPPEFWTVTFGAMATVGLGDIVADQAWWRGASPADLASNARAFAGDVQSHHVRFFVNDSVPRRTEDVTAFDPGEHIEMVLLPANMHLDAAFTTNGVEHEFDIHPGLHSGVYRSVWVRSMLEAQYARVRHADGSGNPPPDPTIFDYRTTKTRFGVWRWTFDVRRNAVEFLNLTAVSCDGLTLRGTGSVTVTVPKACGTGRGGHRTFTVDLGPSQATDEPAGLGSTGLYGRTETLRLEPTGARGAG